MRIVSLVPSLTELVWWFGLGEQLAGRTTFCEEPAGQIEHVPRFGGTKNPKVERIAALAPDLVLANKEENRREDVEALRAAGLEVLVTDPNTVPEAVQMIRELGELLGCRMRAQVLTSAIEAELALPAPVAQRRVFVPIWKEPLLGLGSATYGHDLLEWAGAVNVLGRLERYPEVTRETVRALEPDLVLLPDEPYPFTDADAAEWREITPAQVIDGKLPWWYGPRIPQAIAALRAMFAATGPG